MIIAAFATLMLIRVADDEHIDDVIVICTVLPLRGVTVIFAY